jgi:S-adenosylmethionine hydrolase
MDKRPVITLLTDYGMRDSYVGSIKGVICSINPNANIIDITHDIKGQDIIEAAFVLYTAYKYFPVRTIHVVIVDPTVGSNRRILLVVSDEYYFIAPDNGVLSLIYETGTVSTVYEVNAEHYYLSEVSPTFHGRDIIAPVAAWLSKGIESDKFGDPITDYFKLTLPKPRLMPPKALRGVAFHIDRFGNIISNISSEDIKKAKEEYKSEKFKIIIGKFEINSLKNTYCEGNKGELIALIGSSGFLEVASYQGDASFIANACRGTEITLIFQ